MNKVAGNERISQLLPTVKCSYCGHDVHLRQLGTHHCSKRPSVPSLSDEKKLPTINKSTTTLPISPRSPGGYYSRRNNPDDSFSSYLPPLSQQKMTSPNLRDYSFFPKVKETHNGERQICPRTDSLSNLHLHNGKNTRTMDRFIDHEQGPTNGNQCHQQNSHLRRQPRVDPICAACHRPIVDISPIRVLGQTYHPGHIQCCRCLCPIQTGAREYQQRVYCKKDYKALFLPKCQICHLSVEKNAVSAMNDQLQGKWHRDCFGCHTCRQPFPDSTFYVFDKLPYCKRHYHQLNNSLCRTCDEPIEGACVQTIEDGRCHPACFKCKICRCALMDTYYLYEHQIYCETHIYQLQKQADVGTEKRKTQFGTI